MNTSRKKKKSNSKAPAKTTKGPKKSARPMCDRPYGFLVKRDGTLETKEERKKRLARLEALTLRAFQMAYDNYHNQ
jgi:hypothetical protein